MNTCSGFQPDKRQADGEKFPLALPLVSLSLPVATFNVKAKETKTRLLPDFHSFTTRS